MGSRPLRKIYDNDSQHRIAISCRRPIPRLHNVSTRFARREAMHVQCTILVVCPTVDWRHTAENTEEMGI
jgi:hypothetical protein